jgi:rod shape-determining protein MreB
LKTGKTLQVKGRDTITGLPREIELTSSDVTAAINRPLGLIVGVVKAVLEEIPPELSSDIIDKGIVMTGGSSQLTNLDRMMTEETGVPCHVAEEPILCVVKGTGVALEHIDLYKRSIARQR